LLTLLPEKLAIDGRIVPEQRRRGLFAVNVYNATLDVVAEFQIAELRAMAADGRLIDWSAARLEIGLSDTRSIDGATVEVDGQRIDWAPGSGSALSALRANLGAQALNGRETVSVRFSLTLAGSGKLGVVPSARTAFAPAGRCRISAGLSASSGTAPACAASHRPRPSSNRRSASHC
jgi:inner membrane protein